MTKDKMVAYLGRIGPRTSTHHWRRFDLNVTYFKTKSKQQKQKTEKKLADEDMTLEPPTFEEVTLEPLTLEAAVDIT